METFYKELSNIDWRYSENVFSPLPIYVTKKAREIVFNDWNGDFKSMDLKDGDCYLFYENEVVGKIKYIRYRDMYVVYLNGEI